MKVKLHFFSYLREYLPPQSNARGELELWLPDQSSLRDLFTTLGFDQRLEKEIFVAEVGYTFQVLINQVAVHDYTHALADGDEIVLFPPMAGG